VYLTSASRPLNYTAPEPGKAMLISLVDVIEMLQRADISQLLGG
jgi:hypothetical protein